MNSQQDVFKLIQSYLYYNSNAAIDSGKPVNAEPTTCSISIIVVCDTIIVSTIQTQYEVSFHYFKIENSSKHLSLDGQINDNVTIRKQQGTALAVLFISLINKQNNMK